MCGVIPEYYFAQNRFVIMKFYANTQIHRFSNGMEAYVLPTPGGTVMAECYIKTGSIHEEKDSGCGLSHFLEHMLFQGCQGFPGTMAADTLQKSDPVFQDCPGHDKRSGQNWCRH